MAYTNEMRRQSNSWYNDALAKAGIRDLSGAMASLNRALGYDRTNTTARDLLGLIYYARGEAPEAISQWILSQNMDPRDRLASYFLKAVENEPDELQAINISIRKYNQGLRYCREEHVDMALLQLQEAVEINPWLLKAWQLLALIYLTRRQYSKARKALDYARRIDSGDELTQTYLHELSRIRPRRIASSDGERRSGGARTVSYKRGNETIIRPVNQDDDSSPSKTWGNIMIGLVMGAAVVFLLIGPLIRSTSHKQANRKIAAYTDKIAAQEAQIDALKTELDELRKNSDNQKDDSTGATTQESYEYLMTAVDQYSNGTNSNAAIVETLLKIDPNKLGKQGKERYDTYANMLFPSVIENEWAEGQYAYNTGKYEDAIKRLVKVVRMDSDYEDGKAMLLLANAYMKTDDKETAKSYYEKIIKKHADTAVGKAAKSGLEGKVKELTELEDSGTDSGSTTGAGTDTTGTAGTAGTDTTAAGNGTAATGNGTAGTDTTAGGTGTAATGTAGTTGN